MSTITACSIVTTIFVSDIPGPDEVLVTIDGEQVKAFEFYSDELTFTEDEFIGLTLEEARALFRERDIAYLQAP